MPCVDGRGRHEGLFFLYFLELTRDWNEMEMKVEVSYPGWAWYTAARPLQCTCVIPVSPCLPMPLAPPVYLGFRIFDVRAISRWGLLMPTATSAPV